MDEQAERFTQICEEHYNRVLGYALRRTASRDDAYDVTSETFVVAWRRIDVVPDGDPARLWLYAATRRVLANHHRSGRRRSELHDRLRTEDRTRPSSDDPVAAGDPIGSDVESIWLALEQLPDTDRELLTLHAWEGLDRSELAETMGCSRPTLRVRLHRARRRLARALAAQGFEVDQRTSDMSMAPSMEELR